MTWTRRSLASTAVTAVAAGLLWLVLSIPLALVIVIATTAAHPQPGLEGFFAGAR